MLPLTLSSETGKRHQCLWGVFGLQNTVITDGRPNPRAALAISLRNLERGARSPTVSRALLRELGVAFLGPRISAGELPHHILKSIDS